MIVGIIIILLAVGLSGCNQQQSQSSGITSSNEILSNPNIYINHSITVQGQYYGNESSFFTSNYMIMCPSSLYAINSDNVDTPTPLVYGATYKFTGNVKFGHLPDSFLTDIVFLEVTKIEII
jgi:hypothetical protein